MRACSAAGGGSASPGPGRAGFLKIFQIPSQILRQILGRGHFLFENRSLIDFQIGNGHVCRPGAYSSFEYRVVVDFQRGNEQVGALLTQMTIFQDGLAPTLAPTGWCGLSGDLIFSTQRIPRSGDPIVSTQRIPRGRDRISYTHYRHNSARPR